MLQIYLLAQSSNADKYLSQKQVVTSDMIKAAGIQSLSGILYLADKWDFVSIDGYQKQLSANYLSTFQQQNFVVMLDGQPVDDGIFDVQNINQLPVSVDQIDFVEFYNSPQIVDGEFTENGLISIHTKKPEKNFSVHLYNGVGDQTGDPGPYVFTKYKSQNVDKLGYYLSLNANEAGKDWYIKSAIKTEQNFATDPEINNRVSNLSNSYNKSRMTATYFKFSANVLGGEQQFVLGNTRQYDFFFFKPYGDEIPVNRYFRFWGFTGHFLNQNKLNFDYNLLYSLNELGQWANKQNLDFNLNQEEYYFRLQANYNNKNFNLLAGVSHKYILGASPLSKFEKSLTLESFYAQVAIMPNNNFSQNLGVYIITDGMKNALKAVMGNYFIINRANSIKSNFSYSEKLFSEDANFWYWYMHGYKFNAPDFNAPDIFGNFNTSKTFTADFDYLLKAAPKVNIDVSLFLRQFSDFYVEKQLYQYYPDQSSFYANDMVYTNANLKTAGFQVELNYIMFPTLSHDLFYSYQKDYWGNNVFRDVWKNMPVNKFNYTLNFRPGDDFGIWARLRYISSTIWYDYKYSSVQSGSEYKMEVNPLINFDVSVSKWFWRKKIFVNMLFRNIFNQSEEYIPIGVSNTLRYYLQLQLLLDSIL